MARRLGIMLATLLLSSVAALPVSAGGLLDEIKARGVLVVGVQTAAPPASMVNERGEIVGFEVDLARVLAERLGVRLQLKQLTDATRIPMIQQGAVDLVIATMTKTRERDKVVDFSITYFVTGQRILVPADSAIRTVEDLAGKRVGVPRGSTSERNLAQIQPAARLIPFDDVTVAFLALQRGQVDAISTDESVLLAVRANAADPRKWEVRGPYFSTEPFGIAMRENESDLRDFVNHTLMELWETGEFRKIYDRWYGPGTKYELPLAFEIEVWPK